MIEILIAFTLVKFEAHWGWWAIFGASLLLKYWQLLYIMIDIYHRL